MSLSPFPQVKKHIGEAVRNILANTFNFLRPDVYFGLFLICAIGFAFINSWGFYICFSVFLICYFAERIIKLLKKNEKVV